jgi:hypothetical protein
MSKDWPQEIRHEKRYGNFKVKDYSKHQNSKNYEKRAGMSEDHLALIRQMPCCASLVMPGGEAHHLKSMGNRGMGIRSEDRWAVPMAHDPHMEVERAGSRNEVKWFQEHGIADVRELAEALWANTGDLSKMIAVLIAHREIG